jgi:hypothetical protein
VGIARAEIYLLATPTKSFISNYKGKYHQLHAAIYHIETMYFYTLAKICVTIAGVVGHSVVLNIPEVPPSGTQVLSGSFQGFSMEMASFPDIAGNLK